MFRVILLLMLVLCGCSPYSPAAPRRIELDGRTWTYAEPGVPTVHDVGMTISIYTTKDPLVRLQEKVAKPDFTGIRKRVLTTQINQGDKWIDHGLRSDWFKDGSRDESVYQFGELHGTQRAWYPNGQLHIEREWRNGMENGRDRGWYEDGKPNYDVIMRDGKEVSGHGWDKDGKPI